MTRDEILREILSDKDLMKKYNIKEKAIKEITCAVPNSGKIAQVMATVIKEVDNGKTGRQIYQTIKNIHNI